MKLYFLSYILTIFLQEILSALVKNRIFLYFCKNVRINKSMNLFLKAKHWQLFPATFGLTLTPNLLFPRALLQKKEMPAFYSLLALIPVLVNLCRLWSVGTCLQRRIPEPLKMKLPLFRLFFVVLTGEIPFTYLYSDIWRGTTPLHLLRQFHTLTTQCYFLIIPTLLLASFARFIVSGLLRVPLKQPNYTV